jgi:hemerythrin-like metal-binding protein
MTKTSREPQTVFPWSPAYAVGVPLLDADHMRLFGLAEDMHRAMSEGKGRVFLNALLAQLVDYACYHFAREERFMKRIRYPGYRAHQREHAALRSAVKAMRSRAASGEITMTIEAMQFLVEWLKSHIAGSDRSIGEYLLANRVTPPPAEAP